MSDVYAVIFDLDGTLLDTIEDIARAMNDALVAHGLPPHDLPAYRRFVGEGVANLVRRALPPEQAHLYDAVMGSYRIRYAENMVVQTRPYPGVEQVLVALQRRRVRLGVLSNKPDLATQRLVAQFFPRTFDEVAGERMGLPRKPDPRTALEMAAALGVRPGECAFVGDTRVDMETANAARMLPVGVTWGFRDEQELRGSGAQRIVHEAGGLLEALPLAPVE